MVLSALTGRSKIDLFAWQGFGRAGAHCSPCFFALANDGFVRSRLERVHARRIIEVEKSCNRYPTLKFQK